MRQHVVAVDVGTGSARAGVLDRSGVLRGRSDHPIAMHRPAENFAEHDSEDIWAAACKAVRGACADAGVAASEIAGISFDATCSLVLRDRAGEQLAVSPGGDKRWDTIVWLDHRGLAEADECTASRHRVLDFIGGVMSPEMETPKLMWLKRHNPESWRSAGHFFDLADFLTWRASGSAARSQCTLTCKWTYLAHETPGWQRDFFEEMGIGDMLECGGLPERASPIATDLGPLTASAAEDLGLDGDCRVGAGLIDAHAGALGVLGNLARRPEALERHMALIAGTSSCVMALASREMPSPGIWGPYYGAALPKGWLVEGGQSATGALLDHILRWHGAGGEPTGALHERVVARIQAMRAVEGYDLGGRLHVVPDFHGNRSPLADPHAVGVISGLTLDSSFDSLCRLYWRTAVGIALGVRHILERLNENGYGIDTLHVTGGHTRNPLLMELYADATGCSVVIPSTKDAVLLGTGMVAAAAAGLHEGLAAACAGMHRGGTERKPDPGVRPRFDRDYRIFLAMHEQRRALDALM